MTLTALHCGVHCHMDLVVYVLIVFVCIVGSTHCIIGLMHVCTISIQLPDGSAVSRYCGFTID